MTDQYRPEGRSNDDANRPGDPAWTEPAASERGSVQGAVEPVIHQLNSIMDNLASYATPVLREIAARAAELAAKAGQAAGPAAYKAAEKTEEVGTRLAAKGREVASDLRRDSDAPGSTSETPASSPAQTPAAADTGTPPTDAAGRA
jgi:hypothetical protein